jgi:hypothetical protein
MSARRLPLEFLLIGLVALIATIGVIDAAAGRSPDLVALFATIDGLAIVLARRAWIGRRPICARPDLVSWMTELAAAGAESVDDVADRAIGAYRAGWNPARPD